MDDYVPFYFTPFSPMLFNIKTGWNGLQKRSMEEIIILVSSLPKLDQHGVSFVFADRHAYLKAAQFSSDLADLDRIDWKILQNRDFKHDSNDPGKKERYMAEALAHECVPIQALGAVICYSGEQQGHLAALVNEQGEILKVVAKPGWYV